MSSVINRALLLCLSESKSPCLGANVLSLRINRELLIWINTRGCDISIFAAISEHGQNYTVSYLYTNSICHTHSIKIIQ